MKKLLLSATLLSLACGTALASGKGKPLADDQMDQISAGSAIAIGHDAKAENTTTATVKLDGHALKDATAVNLVNAADSTVGNGVNVWIGSVGIEHVKQLNIILQKGIPDGGPAEFDASAERPEVPRDMDTLDARVLEGFEAELDVDALAAFGGHATNKSEFSVSLGGDAEENAKAVNIVNAAGSLVANGVNVAAGSRVVSTPDNVTMNALSSNSVVNGAGELSQVNLIVQLGH